MKVLTKFLLVLLITILGVSLSSSASYKDSPIGQIHEARCADSSSGVVNASGDITLNGEKVDRLDCSRIEYYSFPEVKADPGFIYNPEPRIDKLVLSILTPIVILLVFTGLISWRSEFGWKRSIGYSLGSAFSSILGLASSALIGDLIGDLPSILSLFLLLPAVIGIALVPGLILHNNKIHSRETMKKLGVTLITYIGLLIASLGLMFQMMTPL